MNQEIAYDGFTSVPSDYECADGQLAAAINVIPEDGALHPINQPSSLFSLDSNVEKVFVHKPQNTVNYILLTKTTGVSTYNYTLSWRTASGDSTDICSLTAEEVYDIASVGNTLIVATSEGMRYILWKDNTYTLLGERPPFISIDFGVYNVGSLTESSTIQVPTSWSGYLSGTPSRVSVSKTDLAEFTQNVYGLLLSEVAEGVTSQGYFYQPFFVRYAYRLFDGSYYWHSAPILMLLSTIPPIITCGTTSNGDDGYVKLPITLDVPYHALAYRILADDTITNKLQNWEDIISGIDVFVSAPIYTYDQSADILDRPFITKGSMLNTIGAWSSLNTWNRGRDNNASSKPSSAFIGHYGGSLTGSYTDQTVETTDSTYVVNIARHSEFLDNIRDCANFYKVAEIDFKDIKAMTDMTDLPLLFTDMTSLRERKTMTDDYRSHCPIIAKHLFAYNSRLNMSGITLYPAEPLPIRSSVALTQSDDVTADKVQIRVWSRINGVRCYSERVGTSEYDKWFGLSSGKNFPRYIFYPDSTAYKMEIRSGSMTFIIDLTPHDFLNGAYYFNPGIDTDPTPTSGAAESGVTATSVAMPTKVYTSEVSNPFMFLASNINTVGDGEVLALSAAVKALSEGQFGQFPLYAFTSEGVWSLQTSTTGTYTSVQPITRDVCTNPAGICQLDSSVLFATDRGIMQLIGSTAQCITDAINSNYPFDVTTLPHFADLHKMIHSDSDTCVPAKPFNDFIAKDDILCDILYDYVHQRIFIYNPSVTYAYVFSLKSKAWGMTFSRMQYTVNAYPQALAVAKDSNGSLYLADYSNSLTNNVGVLYVTRPLKLGTANELKTVTALIQRGMYARGTVKTVLYGSRDMVNWHMVSSSQDHYLRGMRGTPYKYFRICGVASELGDNESIFGASVQFDLRQTNQLR